MLDASKMSMGISHMAVSFIYIGRMPFLTPTLDNAEPLFALLLIPGFFLHQVEVADQQPASGSLSTFLL